MTAPYLLTNNSKTKVLLSLKKAYSNEGVLTLNMAGKIEALNFSMFITSPIKSEMANL